MLLNGILAGFLLVVFLYEMAVFAEPGRSIERMAVTWWLLGYLGLLPCFFAQIRWLTEDHQANSVRLALAVFVPKGCDIGAYAVGRLIGRHKMTPVLEPKKTWEGAIGGLAFASLTAHRHRPARPELAPAAGCPMGNRFRIERRHRGHARRSGRIADQTRLPDRRTRQPAVPGFGGVLDVVDAIIYSAPVCYLWFFLLK